MVVPRQGRREGAVQLAARDLEEPRFDGVPGRHEELRDSDVVAAVAGVAGAVGGDRERRRVFRLCVVVRICPRLQEASHHVGVAHPSRMPEQRAFR